MLLALNGVAQKHEGHAMSKSPDERAKQQTAKMTEHLDLDDKQQTLVAEINLNYARHFQKIHESRVDQEAAKEEMKKLRAQKESELQAVLNQDQFDLLLEHKQKRQAHRQEKRKECEKK